MSERQEQFRADLDRVHVELSRKPAALRPATLPPLPPRLWEDLRLLLQAEYRRATGEHHAVLIVQNGGNNE